MTTCSYCTRAPSSKIYISRTKLNNGTRYLCTRCSNRYLPAIQRDVHLIGGAVTVIPITTPAHHSCPKE